MMHLNRTIYIFDVDGTLTESRQKMNPHFAKKFINWSQDKILVLSTGSDFVKTCEQLPKNVLNLFDMIFCCMGNELRDNSGNIIYKNKFVPKEGFLEDIQSIVEKSKFKIKTGNHIEIRTGMVNISTVGRNADKTERLKYNLWDNRNKEREKIVNKLVKKYPEYNFSIGGEISIDVIPIGKDKGQCIDHVIKEYNPKRIEFYGDKIFPGGNDYGIVRALENSGLESFAWTNVTGPESLAKDFLNI